MIEVNSALRIWISVEVPADSEREKKILALKEYPNKPINNNGQSAEIQRENRPPQPETSGGDGRVRADHAGSFGCHVQG